MLETCHSCGTVFDIDENILSKKIKWLRCGVCNEKWSVSSIVHKNFDKSTTKDKKKFVSKKVGFKNRIIKERKATFLLNNNFVSLYNPKIVSIEKVLLII